MSAAVEGSLEGIPSIGFSLLDYAQNADFTEGEEYIRKILKKKKMTNIEWIREETPPFI